MKSSFPYLVDIGLGTYCPLAGTKCKVPCYASSRSDGKCADGYFVSNTLKKALLEANVFEVVFGGLEPTLFKADSNLYPIDYILKSYKKSNFKVGITTRNYNAYKLKNFENIFSNINTCAISANTLEDLKEACKLAKEICNLDCPSRPSVYIQNIFGLYDYESFKEFCLQFKREKEKNYWLFSGLTFLGYKTYGLGSTYTPFEMPDNWIQFVKDLGINFGVDSIMASKWRDKLVDAGVERYYLVGQEGGSSCYVDALNKSVKSSSFTDEEYKIKEVDWNGENFLKAFGKF